MKTVKLTRKLLKLTPAEICVKVGAADIKNRQTFPQHVYASKKDMEKIRLNLTRLAKREHPKAAKKFINGIVSYEMLQYAPNGSLEDAIKDGHLLVDEDSIEQLKNLNKK